MSGIFGIFNRNGKSVDKEIVNTMLDAMSYWKPDEQGVWIDDPVALGHAMLWNTPESKYEHLPLEKDAYVLTMDARIDNREELAKEIELPDRPISEIGDSEFILAAYKKWGEECPKHLLGDFVFAIWDEKKQQLFCARDHVGIKQFYYYLNDGKFIFGNDIKVIVSNLDDNLEINKHSVALYLGNEGILKNDQTFFTHIVKLPSASILTINKHKFQIKSFWNIEDIKPIQYDTLEEYTAKLKSLLKNSVSCRIRSCYQVSSHLSGGIDSSSIAVLASRMLNKENKKLLAFNWVLRPEKSEKKEDLCEWSFADQIAEKENIELYNLQFSAAYMAQMYASIDIATNESVFYWEENIVRDKVNEIGSRLILSGWGGDELISYDGYAYSSGLFWQGNIIKYFKQIYKENKNISFKSFIKQSIRMIIYPIFYKYMNGLYKREKNHDFFRYTTAEFKKYIDTLHFTEDKYVAGAHREQLSLFNRGHVQQRIESWAASSVSKRVEYAYPLLDKRIVEYALAIPEELYAKNNNITRFFFKNTLSSLLPKNIIWSGKFAEAYHVEKLKKLWNEALILWLTDVDKSDHLFYHNPYVDYDRIKVSINKALLNEKSNDVNKKILSAIVPSISLLNIGGSL